MRHGKFNGIMRAGAVLGALAAPFAASAGSAVGVWQTEPMGLGGYAHVRIAPCADKSDRLCGRIEKIISSKRDDLVGVELLRDMVAEGSDRWGDGSIYSPDKGQYYDSHMILTGDGLEVRGCLLAICKSQKWARVE
jgi:uncharacterized protein (DUF2147 family)